MIFGGCVAFVIGFMDDSAAFDDQKTIAPFNLTDGFRGIG